MNTMHGALMSFFLLSRLCYVRPGKLCTYYKGQSEKNFFLLAYVMHKAM